MNILTAFGGVTRLLQMLLGAGIVIVGIAFLLSGGAGKLAPVAKDVVGFTPVGKVGAAADAVKHTAEAAAS